MRTSGKTKEELLRENEDLRTRLDEAEETLRAIRSGEIDGLVVTTPEGEKVFTLQGADYPYRVLIEQMSEGALTMTVDGAILYCNRRFAEIVKMPLEEVINSSFYHLIAPDDQWVVNAFVDGKSGREGRWETRLRRQDRSTVPVYLSFSFMPTDQVRSICAVVTDLTEQKRSEEIVKSAQLIQSVFGQSAEAILVCDLTGRIVQASQEALNRFPGELLGRPFDSACPLSMNTAPPGQSEPFSVSTVLAGKALRSAEVTHSRSDGSESHFLLSARPLSDSKKTLLGCVISLTDITERKRAEAALKDSEERFRKVFENALTGIGITSWEGRFQQANPSYCSLLGYTEEELLRMDFASLIHPEDREANMQEIRRLQAGESPSFVIENRYVSKDGQPVWVRKYVSTLPEKTGRPGYFVALVTDVTERKRAEEQLRKTELKYRIISENTYDWEFWIDPEGNYIYASPSCKKVTGHEAEEFITSPGLRREIVFPEDLPIFDRHRQEEEEEEEEEVHPVEIAYRIVHADGSLHWIGHVCKRIFDDQGRFLGIRGSNRDITERKQAETRLEADLAALARMHALSGRILGVDGLQQVLKEVMDVAIAVMGADLGTLQLLEDDTLRIVAHHGHQQPFLEFFASAENKVSVCGEAMQRGERVVIPDIETSSLFAGTPSLGALREAGVRAVQSTPMISRTGALLGILTTQWTVPHSPDEHDLWRIDLLARLAADMIEYTKAMAMLRRSEQRVRALVAHLPGGAAFLLDGDLRYLLADGEALYTAGFKPSDLEGKTIFEVLDPALAASYEPMYRQGLAGEPFTHEHEAHGRFFISHGTPLRSENGDVYAVLAVSYDITERKQMEAEIIRSRDELELRVMERTAELSEAIQRLRAENAQRKLLEETLRKSDTQVRFFASQCLIAQETERKRIAGELHDSIAASLSAIRFRIDATAEELKTGRGSSETLLDLGLKVAEINNDVRRIMADLRPAVLDDLGIIPAINWFCREYQKSYSHIRVEKQAEIAEEEVPDSLKTPIFRIVQEAMNNIAKHSNAGFLSLSLRKEDDTILLTIRDDGRGFNPATAKKGMGLSTMMERAELSGGILKIESTTGRGTIIRASWRL